MFQSFFGAITVQPATLKLVVWLTVKRTDEKA